MKKNVTSGARSYDKGGEFNKIAYTFQRKYVSEIT